MELEQDLDTQDSDNQDNLDTDDSQDQDVDARIQAALAEQKEALEKQFKRRLGRAKRQQSPDNAPKEADYFSRSVERIFDRTVGKFDLTDRQEKVLENLIKQDQPEDVKTWMTETIADLGWAKKSEPQTPPTPPQPKNSRPESDTGAPGTAPLYQITGNPHQINAQ